MQRSSNGSSGVPATASSMGSLFDIAAELSQYGDDAERSSFASVASTQHEARKSLDASTANRPLAIENSTLSLLDEAFQTIYETHQPQQKSPRVLLSAKSAPQLRRQENEPKRTRTPLQNVFSRSVAFKQTEVSTSASASTRVPPPPPHPLARDSTQAADADLHAKAALRELHDELEQVPKEAADSPKRLARLQRSLTAKFLRDRLDKLPGTPFVLLARKKVQVKIERLSEQAPTASVAASTVPPVFAADQHHTLVKLALVPDSHVAKLSQGQQRMVQFARRYDKILKISGEELARLPVSQTQLLQQLQRSMQSINQHSK